MSHKEKFNRHFKGCLWLAFSIVCYVLFFCFLDYDWVCVLTLLLSLAGMVMIIVVHTKKINDAEITDLVKNTIYQNPMSLEDIKKEYHFLNLDLFDGKILKAYFNADNTKRCIVVKESNAVRVLFQDLVFRSDEEKLWILDFAYWQNANESCNSLYADEEIALKDNAEKLKDYHEEEYHQTKLNRYSAEIWWKIDINSPLIPFASYNKFDVIINGKTIKDVIIHNTQWYDKNTSDANIFVSEKFNKSFKFKVLNEGNVIATGKHYMQ